MFEQLSREQMRQMYVDVWQKHAQGLPLEPLERQIAEVIAAHPEYHKELSIEETTIKDYTPDGGHENPFLHMGLHIAVREQCSTNRPEGIKAVFDTLTRLLGDRHAAEHAILDCLAETLWEAQRSGQAPDEALYLRRIRAVADRLN